MSGSIMLSKCSPPKLHPSLRVSPSRGLVLLIPVTKLFPGLSPHAHSADLRDSGQQDFRVLLPWCEPAGRTGARGPHPSGFPCPSFLPVCSDPC